MVDLLDSEASAEMLEVLDSWQVPSARSLDLTLGTVYDGGSGSSSSSGSSEHDGGLVPLTQLPAVRDLVYWSYRVDEDFDSASFDPSLRFRGRIVAVLGSDLHLAQFVVSTNPEGLTQQFFASELRVERAIEEPVMQFMSGSGGSIVRSTERDRGGGGRDGADIQFDENEEGINDEIDQVDDLGPDGAVIRRVEYKPSDPNWELNEQLLLSQLEQRDRKRAEQGPEPEPPGIDAFLLVPPPESAIAVIEDKRVPLAGSTARQVEVGTQVRRGFDLVRVGNFSEDPNGLQVNDR